MTDTTNPINAYSYIRVSTVMQVDGYSLEAQKNEIMKWANYKGINIVGEYSDEGISGKNIKNRKGFQQMLTDIRSKKDDVKYVIVYKLSRFGRNASDILTSIEFMQDHGVNLHCVSESLDSGESSGKLMIPILSAVSELERENINIQTMAGRKQKASEGGWNGGFAPYGYRLDNGNLIIEPQEAETVKLIFDLYINQDLGAIGIAKRLNVRGIEKVVRQNGSLNTFSAHFIKQILDNPVYKGYISYGRRKKEKIEGKRGEYHTVKETNEANIIVTKGKHEAIISEELWNLAHKKRIETGKKKEKIEKEHEYILSGLIKCPGCGKSMYGIPSRKKRKDGTPYPVSYSYACRQKNNATGHDCPLHKQFNCRDIDDQVARILLWQLPDTEVLEKIAEQTYKEDIDSESLQKRIVESKNKTKICDDNIETYNDLIKKLDSTKPEEKMQIQFYSQNITNIFREKMFLESLIKEDENKIINAEIRKEKWSKSLEVLKKLVKHYDSYSDIEKKRLMQGLIKSIEIYPTKKENGYIKSIEFKFPILKDVGNENEYKFWVLHKDMFDDENDIGDDSDDEYDPDAELYDDSNPLAKDADENGYIRVYPDQTEFPPYDTHDETVVLLSRK
ncbi:MAG: recombinase family protein [Oscillospiraceae bacterium]|nr:recombinase family protein [Oscillospiraceae bacterium]